MRLSRTPDFENLAARGPRISFAGVTCHDRAGPARAAADAAFMDEDGTWGDRLIKLAASWAVFDHGPTPEWSPRAQALAAPGTDDAPAGPLQTRALA
jgi:hypothetical protein